MKNISIIKRLRNKFRIQRANNIDFGKNIKMSKCKIIIKGTNNTLCIGDNSILRDVFFEIIGTNCSIIIGKNSTIGHNSYLSAKGNKILLTVGKNCMFSRNVKIMTSDGHPIFLNGKKYNLEKSIIIENNVWLADGVTVLKGITIGENSVIGINSTLTKSIPSNTISAGNPAKIIKENITWKP
ncbi:MAG: acyltransferase [Sulfurospirillaceae bacterium]|nr:acyltransferase [Sulfurospirillaceae bacterium]MDY0238360.1 acyltransferase [Campylobacterales bacterium]